MSVDASQRFSEEDPCPVCGGYGGAQRGTGSRCYGFFAVGEPFAHCTREEYAGPITKNEASGTYAHLIGGECGCGVRHEESANGHKEIVATYDYTSPSGELLYQVVRFEPKGFAQRRPDGKGGWVWNLDGIDRVLYRLPEVLRTLLEGETIYICEGEKDVETARSLGFTATTCAEGARKWSSSFNYLFRGANVGLVSDNDPPGREHMEMVARELLAVAKTVKVLELPGVPEGGDLSDWAAAGGTGEGLYELSRSLPPVRLRESENSQMGYVGFGAYRIADLEPPQPRRYLIRNTISPGIATYIYGSASTLKSLIGTLLCISIASTEVDEVLGLAVEKHGPSVIFDSELDKDEIQRRVLQLCAGLGIRVPRDIFYVSAVGIPPQESFPNLLQLAKEVGARVVDIDSLGFATMGDPEAYKDVSRILRDHIDPLRAEGIAPLIIDHKPHQGDHLFGSVAKTYHGRFIFQTEDLDGENRTPRQRNIRLTNRKTSFGDPGRRLALRFEFAPEDGPIKVKIQGTSPPTETPTRESVIQRSLTAGEKTKKELAAGTGIPESSLENILPGMVDKRLIHVPYKRGRANVYRNGPPTPEDTNSHFLSNARREERVRVRKGLRLVSSAEDLITMTQDLGAAPELGLDLETYPQDETARSLDPRRGSVGVISLASRDTTYVIDRNAIPAGEVQKALQEILSEKTLVAHNAPFDLAFLRRDVGYEHNGPVHDTLVLDGMLFYAAGPLTEKEAWRGFVQKDKEEGYKKALADVAREKLGLEFVKAVREADWGGKLSEEMVAYAASDASVLLSLKDALVSELEALSMGAVVDLEARFTPSMAYCSDNGFALDVEGWRRHADETARCLEEARETCEALAPDPPEGGWTWAWSASNHRKVGKALEMLGAKVEKRPGTGHYITDEAALKAIKRPKEAKELAAAILTYREREKFVTTWGNSWFREPEVVSKGKTKGKIKQGSPGHLQVVNGRVHTKLNQLVATGRGSSKSPNLQNLPPALRKFFIAPPGRKLLVADYSQAEYAAAAYIAGDEALLEPLRWGEDYHTVTAQMIGVERSTAKMINFALLYGMSAKSLAGRLGISKDKAQEHIDAVRRRAPGLAAWCDAQGQAASRGTPYAKTPLGRVRLVDQTYRRHLERWESNRAQMLNHPIQGACADGYKLAAAMVWERRDEFKGNPLLVNMIHDELVVEVDAAAAETDAALLEAIMLEGMREALGADAPVKVDVNVCSSWAGYEE